MKHCPECNRNYADPTLSFCLQDGASLIFGPAVDEPATAILGKSVTGEQATSTFEEDPKTSRAPFDRTTKTASKKYRILAGAVGIILIAALGVGSYFYYWRPSSRQIDSIAVMPFVNESGNSDIDYLSDGMTETLINTLTQLPNLKVKPRSSAFRYKGRESDARTIGSELNVRAILNGRLVQRGNDITLFLSLIDTGTEDQIWGKQYRRNLANLLTLQTEVARDVSESLKTRLSGTDEAKLTKNYTTNPEAYRLYLQGRYFWNKRRIADNGKAIAFFEQAIAIDPNYALAYAGLADSVAQPSDVVPFQDREKRAKDAVRRALALDENLAESHAALAHIMIRYDLDFSGAQRELERALELDPKWPDIYQRYCELYSFQGKHEEALSKIRQGLELEPFSLPLNTTYGSALVNARRYDEAIEQLKKTVEMDPNFRNARVVLGVAYWLKGMQSESVEQRAKSLELGGLPEFANQVRQRFAADGWNGYLQAEKHRFATSERGIDRTPYLGEAVVLTALGENDRAFEALNKMVETNEKPSFVFLKVEARLDPLRDDPRFHDLLKRVGLPPD